MVFFELQIESPDQRQWAEDCMFRVVSDAPASIIRIGVEPEEDVTVIVTLIRTREQHTRAAGYGINIIPMPSYIPPKAKKGEWYNPSNPPAVVRQSYLDEL